MLWMKLKLNGAPKRNRSGQCSEASEYQKQSCKGTCATFLVSKGGRPLAVQQESTKKNGQRFFGMKKCSQSRQICAKIYAQMLEHVRKVVKIFENICLSLLPFLVLNLIQGSFSPS